MTSDGLVTSIRAHLAAAADPERAPGMQAYMKSTMPYLGVPVPTVRKIVRQLLGEHPVETRATWEETVRRLFDEAGHREEWYAALAVAGHPRFASYQTVESLPLYEHIMVTGAWWDVVDDTSHRVGDVLRADRRRTSAVVRRWASGDAMWLRRCSIICQLGRRGDTDLSLLTTAIDRNLADREFFIRKAIGWALREYARTDPAWVIEFVDARRERLSPLSQREALKHLSTPPSPSGC